MNPKLDTQHASNRIQSGLGSAITQMIIEPNERSLTGNINNTSSAARIDHPARNMPSHQSRAASIHTHHTIETGSRRIDSRLEHRSTSTINKPIEHNIERPKRLINSRFITDIENERLAPRLFSETRKLTNVPRSSHNLSAARAEHLDSHTPNPAGSARHQHRAPGKIEGCLHLDCSRCITGFNAG